MRAFFPQPTAKEAHHATADHPLQVASGLILSAAFAAARFTRLGPATFQPFRFNP
jgi:hypothetical protein